MVCLPSYSIDRPIYIWRIESKLWQIYKRYPLLSPHLQIRRCLIHPYLPQPRAPPYVSISTTLFYNKSNSATPSAATIQTGDQKDKNKQSCIEYVWN